MEEYEGGPPPPPAPPPSGRCAKCGRPLDEHRFQQVLIKEGQYTATTDEAFMCPKPKEEK